MQLTKHNIDYDWERDYTAPPWFSQRVCSSGSLTVVYTSPDNLEEEDA